MKTGPAQSTVALITGGAGAIGQAVARRLAETGTGVVIMDARRDAAQDVADRIAQSYGVFSTAIEADLSSGTCIGDLEDTIARQAGRLDHLIHCAGYNSTDTLLDMPVETWDRTYAVNVRSCFLLAQALVPFWQQQKRGRIVCIGSRTWLSGTGIAYASSKAALVGLVRALAVELGRFSVTANVVAPGYLDTPFNLARSPEHVERTISAQRAISHIPRLATVEDVAGTVSFLLSPDAGAITGEVLHVAGGAQMASRPISPALYG